MIEGSRVAASPIRVQRDYKSIVRTRHKLARQMPSGRLEERCEQREMSPPGMDPRGDPGWGGYIAFAFWGALALLILAIALWDLLRWMI